MSDDDVAFRGAARARHLGAAWRWLGDHPLPTATQIDAAAHKWAREDEARGVRIIPGPRYPAGMVRP